MDDCIIHADLATETLDVATLSTIIRRHDCGAFVGFEGTVRSPSSGHEVLRLEYEAYDRVVVDQMRTIAAEVCAEFSLGGALVVHRTGIVLPGEPAVFAATVAPHRGDAFRGTERLIDRVKTEAAIWKCEIWPEGASWL